MNAPELRIVLDFVPEDRAWIRISKVDVPSFWKGHAVPPALGDIIRLGGRQFTIETRVWEQDNGQTVLRLFLGTGHAHSDTTFG